MRLNDYFSQFFVFLNGTELEKQLILQKKDVFLIFLRLQLLPFVYLNDCYIQRAYLQKKKRKLKSRIQIKIYSLFVPVRWPVSIGFCFLFGNVMLIVVTGCVSSCILAKSGVDIHEDGILPKSLFSFLLFVDSSVERFELETQFLLLSKSLEVTMY